MTGSTQSIQNPNNTFNVYVNYEASTPIVKFNILQQYPQNNPKFLGIIEQFCSQFHKEIWTPKTIKTSVTSGAVGKNLAGVRYPRVKLCQIILLSSRCIQSQEPKQLSTQQ